MNTPAPAPSDADAGAEPGFVLAGEPPVLEHEAPTTEAAPVHPSLDLLAAAALDAAELANRGAQAAAAVTSDMRIAQEALHQAQASSQKKSLIMLISVSVVMLICMTFFLIIGVRMNSRINQLDATLDIAVKRAAEMNTGVESLTTLKDSVGSLTTQVEALAKMSAEVSAKLEATVAQTESLTSQIPSRTAQQVASSAQGVSRQVDALGSRVQAQAAAVQSLSRDVQALKGAVSNVDKLNRDVQALVTLQRERYLETVQRPPAGAPAAAGNRTAAPTAPTPAPAPVAAPAPATTAPAAGPAYALPGTAPSARPTERDATGANRGAVQYPRPPAATSPNAQPTAPAGAIIVGPKPQP